MRKFQAVWQNFAFLKILISLIQKIQFLSDSDALDLTHSFSYEVSDKHSQSENVSKYLSCDAI